MRALDYVAAALDEAEAAARWYAERSPSAARRFSEELDAAEAVIATSPEAWPPFDRLTASSSWRSCISGSGRRIGAGDHLHLANKALQPTSRAEKSITLRRAFRAPRG